MRYPFGLGTADFVMYGDEEGQLVVGAELSVEFYSAASGGSQYTNLVFDPEDEETVDSVTTDTEGGIPAFYGPDGVTEMWADASGGTRPRRRIVTWYVGPAVDQLLLAMDNAENAILALQALAEKGIVVALYNEVTTSWPVRPTIAGDRIVAWIGPDSTPPPAGYMATYDLFWGWV